MDTNDGRDPSPAGATNPEVGKRIGLSYSAVSRIRSGDRYPSLAVMRKIDKAYGWPLAEQLELIPEGGTRDMRYAHEFERRINDANTIKPNTK